jgi:hypothetical protein
MKRLGPDLKMPNFKSGDVKMPKFLGDLFYDLRERRLLAPLALLLVAILAVPFVLGSSSDQSDPGSGAGAAVPPVLETSKAKLTVVEAKPGLRDYRKRLAGREPTNPFKQRYSSPQVAAAELEEGSSSQTTTVTTGGTVGSSTTEASTSPSTNTPTSTPSSGRGTERLTFFTWGINLWINKVPSDPEADAEAVTKPGVLAQTSLPGPKNPVVTFMGLSREAAEKQHEQRALFVVSDEVSKISEGGRCLSRGEGVCQLIEAKADVPITFVYGPGETHYTIKVLKIHLIVTGHS